jgi:N-acetyl-gamma-glutamyl-phosphate reductase
LKNTLDKANNFEQHETSLSDRSLGSSHAAPRIAVAGITGFAGGELARLLLRHPSLAAISPRFFSRPDELDGNKATELSSLHPQLPKSTVESSKVFPFSWDRIRDAGIELLFLATPHEQSREWVPEALGQGIRVIDLSGAWRLHNPSNQKIYGLTDSNPELAAKLQSEAVYGSPELHGDAISRARLVANPGCYATSIILALSPLVNSGLVDLDCGIVCDAKSGVSGAGKAATSKTHFMNAADNLSAYSVFGHRHTGELLEQLHLSSDQIQFTPHLLPIPRGILSTIYLRLKDQITVQVLTDLFLEFYQTSPLIRLRPTPQLPQIQHVAHTNYCDIGFELHSTGKQLVVVSCLDNLLKGAAGQAVQNMNLMYGWDESEGLL